MQREHCPECSIIAPTANFMQQFDPSRAAFVSKTSVVTRLASNCSYYHRLCDQTGCLKSFAAHRVCVRWADPTEISEGVQA